MMAWITKHGYKVRPSSKPDKYIIENIGLYSTVEVGWAFILIKCCINMKAEFKQSSEGCLEACVSENVSLKLTLTLAHGMMPRP